MIVANSIYMICFLFIYRSAALSVEERFTELERIVRLQGETIAKHEKMILDQNVIIKHLEDENMELTLRVESFESNTEIFEEKFLPNANMQNRSDYLEDKKIENTIIETKRPTAVEGVVSTLDRGRIMKRQSNGIAFHAYMTGQKCFHDHEVFVYDHEEVDVGNGYNAQDGIFVVPSSGYYVFSWTFASEWDDWFRSDIIINGVSSGWITTARNNEDGATGTMIAHVNSGDHVFIRRVTGTSCTIRDNLTRPTFSGWKLF